MKKIFLGPLAVALSALLPGISNATVTPTKIEASSIAAKSVVGVDALVLERSTGPGVQTVGHGSHRSHASHSSHASHVSHYSSS